MAESNYYLGSKIGGLVQSQNSRGSQQGALLFGRVIKIALDESTEILDAQGNILPIGTILYRDIAAEKETKATEYPALPLHTNIKQFPLLNEVVMLVQGPTSDIQTNVGTKDVYYSTVVNLWGSNHHNALPEPNTDISTILGKDVKELSDINPMYPFPGDVLIEGRQGQSIRLGGNMSPKNILVDNSNNAKPFVLISNGQIKTDNGIDYIVEDINKDPNSLYFLSDHKSDLIAVNTKRDSYDVVPIGPDQYVGNQVIINGGRLFFNAKEDSAFISAKESIGLNARTLNFDATDYFCVDSKKIYLGVKARTSNTKEPVVLGTQLENWLTSLLDTLESVAIAMSSASSVTGGPVATLNTAGPELQAIIKSLKTQTKLFQSKKVFTE
ncbi:hypothetical protein UFOVP54_86 [uncultured Caudovirales phage]|uniref:Uncharacterized protein n=1 Tax=uncultured Caudovirales phage TaxID=2100421 RepID=A0A6J5KW02_9CAUD|nr:hypothetical protein UFOVP54_86 [uncultured Caudovirales phage]